MAIRSRASLVGLLVSFLAVSGCNYPMDAEGTTRTVVETGILRSGLVAGSDQGAGARHAIEALARDIEAQPSVTKGTAENLMRMLEHGELDIVVGDFAGNSPWSKRVILTSSPMAGDPRKDMPVLRGALRQGENRWYMFVERSFASARS